MYIVERHAEKRVKMPLNAVEHDLELERSFTGGTTRALASIPSPPPSLP